jgi:hypothetical protein
MPDVNVNAAGIPAWYYAAAAGGVFVAYTLYKRISAPKTTPAPAAAPTLTPIVPAGSYGQDYSGQLINLTQQLQDLQQAVSVPANQVATTVKAITGTAANETKLGAGYVPNLGNVYGKATPVSSQGHTYVNVSDLATAYAIGKDLYYQPTPGVFQTFGGSFNNLAPNTPIFQQVV